MASGSQRQITVASLVQHHVALTWQETVALVLEIADVLGRSVPPQLPAYQEVALTAEGSIRFLKAATRRGDPLTILVDILRALLPTDSPAEVWDIASSAAPDSPSHDTVERLAAALRALEHGQPDRREVLTGVHRRARKAIAGAEQDSPSQAGTEPLRLVATSGATVRTIPIDRIQLTPEIGTAAPVALVRLIQTHGVLQPVLIRRLGDGLHELVWGRMWLDAARAAGLAELPCRVCDLDDNDAAALAGLDTRPPAEGRSPQSSRGDDLSPRDARSVVEPTLAEIADSLNAASSCWHLSTEEAQRPYTRTVGEVTRVELLRATWLVQGLRLLMQPPTLNTATHSLGTILERVFQSTRPDRRLNDVKLLANLTEASVLVRVDEGLAVLAGGGMVQGMLALVRHASRPVVRCEVATSRSAAVVTLSQDSVEVPASVIDRFFDETFHGRPGGYGAAVALAVTKRVMELHGSTATVESVDQAGCRVSAHFPLVSPHSERG